YSLNDQSMIGYFVTNPLTGWKLVLTAPENELLGVQEVITQVQLQNENLLSEMGKSESIITISLIVIGLLLMIIGVTVAHFYSKNMNKRIQIINEAMGQ